MFYELGVRNHGIQKRREIEHENFEGFNLF